MFSCQEGLDFSGNFANWLDRVNLSLGTLGAWDGLTGLESSLVNFSLYGTLRGGETCRGACITFVLRFYFMIWLSLKSL